MSIGRTNGVLRVAANAAMAAALTVAAVSGSAVRAQGGAYVVADTWRGAGAELPPGTFRAATGVAVTSDGTAFVADGAEGRISVIAPDETVRVLVPRAGGPGALRAPGHMAVDESAGRLYVADPGLAGIAVFDTAGQRIATWAGLNAPTGIAIAPDGTVVVADAATGEVVRFDAAGRQAARFRVVPAAAGGDLLRGLDVDDRGRVYVVLGAEAAIAVHGAAGGFVTRIAVDPPGVPAEVYDVQVDRDPRGVGPDLLWLASSRGMLMYDSARDAWSVNPIGNDLNALVVDRVTGVFVAHAGGPPVGGRVVRLAYASAASSSVGRTWSGSLLLPGVWSGPEVVSVGADGLVYVLDRGPRVQRVDAFGDSLGQVDRLDPAAVAAAVDGRLFLTDGGVVRSLAAGDWRTARPAESWSQPVAPGASDANAVAVSFDASTGDVLLLDAMAGSVRRFAGSGARGADTPLPGEPESTIWSDMDRAPDGAVYVLDRGSGAVHAIRDGALAGAVQLPDASRRLTAGEGGTLFTLGRDGWIRRYGAAGGLQTAFDATRFDIASASSPSDLAVTEAGDLVVADRQADVLTRFRWDPAAEAGTPPDRGAQCRYFPAKGAEPAAVDVGDDVEVRLSVRGGCGADTSTELLDVVLVLDRSGSMAGERLRALRNAAMNFVVELDLGTTRVGVVSFNDEPRLEVGLTDDPIRIRRAIVSLEAEGGTRIERGLHEARLELGRRARRGARPVFIVLSDGGSDFEDARREADLAKARGVQIYAVGIQAWEGLMRAIATDEAHFFAADSARFLYGIFERIAERVTTSVLFRSVEVTDEIPVNMDYVIGSSEPPATWDDAGRTLSWTLGDVPFTGFALRYVLQPRQAGNWPTNVGAWAAYVDGFDAAGRLEFPVPRVLVRPDAPGSATPSATSVATSSPTASATPTVTATPPAPLPPRPLYMPVLLREPRCQPGLKRADVMLVLDTSSSMSGAKLAAARDAALRFIDLLVLPEDRVGVVSFDGDARLESPLTGDSEALRRVVLELETAVGTRIDLGLSAALAEFEGPRHDPVRTAVIVLLTDGRQEDASAVLVEAERAHARNVVVFSIGLGRDVDAALLGAIAGSGARTYLAPGPEDLADIYERIAVLVPCPPDRYWGRR